MRNTSSNNIFLPDREKLSEPQDWQTVEGEIRKILADPQALPFTKRLLIQIIPLPQSLDALLTRFTGTINPLDADFNILWGLVDLNIKLSYGSQDRLVRTVDWMKRLRRVVELLNRCLGICEDINEPRYAIVDALDCLLQIQGESVRHLRRVSADSEAASGRVLDTKVNAYLSKMDSVVNYLNGINSYSKTSLSRQTKTPELLSSADCICTRKTNCGLPHRNVTKEQEH